ncbi:hypothetical protein [Pseudomonas mosselii]|uniref:hypothetical protein n=1 Tax=Pseudomonas mosselii TaxID=78327 RepID=UPI0021DAC92F|nr:hypothetical protein [Pseudomonas mosselii]MCU9528371.1 hypothetical protein [Pseudomonas mosselii]MCU9535544.1 hypothetical protein [Pseudomonas mosselii]MCU9547395.1 hypothetical protein [Pseudomonas mosselii]
MKTMLPNLLIRIFLHLVTAVIVVGILYLCWSFVGSRIRLDFPANSLGGAMQFPVQLACTAMLSMFFGLVFKALTLDLPRHIRRKRFWQREHGEA